MQRELRFRLIRHLTYLENELADYNAFSSLSWEQYNTDRSKRRDVERWIENIINSSVDMAKLVLNAEARPLPDTYRDIVKGLSLVQGFDGELMESLSRRVSLRNVISHEYLDIRWSSIKKFIEETQPLYEKFSLAAKHYLENKRDAE